jgi:hypothetical protein
MRVSMRASGSLSMPISATCSGTAMPAMMQACISWRARASVTAMMPTGLGRLCSQAICCSTASSHDGALVPWPRIDLRFHAVAPHQRAEGVLALLGPAVSCASGRLNIAKCAGRPRSGDRGPA